MLGHTGLTQVVTLLVVQLDVQEMTKVTLMVTKLGTLWEVVTMVLQ